jgi:1-acyl-sn-glycerol-3-phosphate acyltransferase
MTNNDSHQRRTGPAPEKRTSIRALHAADVLFARIYNRLTPLNPCPVPSRGPAILVCNHISPIDPAFLQAVCRQRLIIWMMAKEYMQIPATGWFFRTVGIIPVERSGRDTAPLRAAIRALGEGAVLGIFPEGRIAPTRQLLPFQTGVALMAIKTNAPVYPAYLDGTQRGKEMLRACLERNDAILRFGPPVDFDRSGTSKNHLDLATQNIQDAVKQLQREVLALSSSGLSVYK